MTNKTTEALTLAEEALEELHYSSGTVKAVTLYKSALAAIREALAEPVAHYKDAPHTIYLQTGCDDPDPVNCECAFNEWGDTSWCADQIHDTDIPYIRADYAAPVDAKAIRAEAFEEAEEIAKTIGGSFSVEFLAAIRSLK